LWSLTFEFAKDVRTPALGTYYDEPDAQCKLPRSPPLKAIEFRINKAYETSYLVGLRIVSASSDTLCEVQGAEPTNSVQRVVLDGDESIVAAKVDTWVNVPVKIAFVVARLSNNTFQ
jgi:hypothetical protein